MPNRKIEQVLSGQQIVQPDGRWDRVHGVNHDDPDVVYVTTDRAHDVPYPRGTQVELV